MKNVNIGLVTVIIIAIIAIVSFAVTWSPQAEPQNKVVTTIFPIYDIASNIAGETIDVELILPPGASPHTFEPTPQDIRLLQNSQALFYIGHGLDNWALDIAKAADITNTITVDKYVELHNSEHNHGETEQTDGLNDEQQQDPHYWLTVHNANSIARLIFEELQKTFPQYEQELETNYKRYLEDLTMLDQEIRNELAKLESNKIAIFHGAWDYYAEEYGLEIVATFEEFPGKEPSTTYVADFQESIIQNNIRAIFSEPQFSTAALQPIATDLGVTISILDPIGGTKNRDSYRNMMRYNTQQIINALQ